MKSPARTPSVDVEGCLLDAAERLLSEGGPAALSVRRMAEAAGVAPMGVYNRFGGKNGIVGELFTRGFDELAVSIRGVTDPDPVEALRQCGERYHAFAMAKPATYAVMFDRAIPGFEPSPEACAHAAACFEELATHVRRAIAAGAVIAGDPVDIAQQLWASMHGLVSLQLRDLGFVTDWEAHRDRLSFTLLRGLTP